MWRKILNESISEMDERGLRHITMSATQELKLGDFKPADKGQMELYLRWLDKYERQSGEEKPIGLILCAGKKHETVELLELEKSSIRVAEYLTELPPREILERELHKAIAQARQRFAKRQQPKKEVDL
ncbi:MAG: PDDEXK nuclease domain-containing protein [Pseudomonadota bacterium]